MKVHEGESRHFCDDPICPDPVWKPVRTCPDEGLGVVWKLLSTYLCIIQMVNVYPVSIREAGVSFWQRPRRPRAGCRQGGRPARRRRTWPWPRLLYREFNLEEWAQTLGALSSQRAGADIKKHRRRTSPSKSKGKDRRRLCRPSCLNAEESISKTQSPHEVHHQKN